MKIMLLTAATAALTLIAITPALGQITIRIGTYNVCESDSRAKHVRSGKYPVQHLYRYSADAIAAMIAQLDCDIIGLEEVCDSMWVEAGSGNIDLRKKVAQHRGDKDYAWVLYPNASNATRISYDSAIGYNKRKLKKLESGIFWMTATPDADKSAPGAPKGTVRPTVWAKFRHRESGKEFFFYATHLVLGSMYKDGGTEYNATWFMNVAQDRFPDKYPSFVVGDFNSASGDPAYLIMTGGRWADTYDTLVEKGYGISDTDLEWGSMAKVDESGWSKGKIDHIMFYGATPISYRIDRSMLPTADGSLHYPSDHLPLVAEFEM